jgi:hypothetical protein
LLHKDTKKLETNANDPEWVAPGSKVALDV